VPTIEFHSYDTDTVKNFRPVLAKTVQPEWWKTLKVGMDVHGKRITTVRACPAMDDWLKMGWYLVANRDMEVNCGVGTDSDSTEFYTKDKNDGYASPSHNHTQMGNAFEYMGTHGPVNDAFKMRNPWNIVTPSGYSCFYLDPFLFQNQYFATWQGIIDTDTFNSNMDNAQIIFYPKVQKSFTIKEGTPLCQVVPFKREEWNASYMQFDHQTFQENRSSVTTHLDGKYAKSMDEWGRHKGLSDEERNVSLQMGAYRKGEYWQPKGKFYKEESPPPECPFHKVVSEETENQLELDLDNGS